MATETISIAKARAAYLAVVNLWHEADPDHCGGECFRDSAVDSALGITRHDARPPHPDTMAGK